MLDFYRISLQSILVFLALFSMGRPSASALTIDLDYSFDTNGFFGDATAKAAVDQAAADISSAITSSLTAVDTVSFTAGFGSDIATYNTAVFFTHPASGSSQLHDVTTDPLAADTVVVYVGSRILGGNTLGAGGFSAVTPGTGGTTATTAPTVEAAADLLNIHLERGGGAILSEVTQAINGHTGTLRAGATVGHLWFDHDTDNNGALDTQDWHFDHTTAVASGKDDLYSVALHEILHSIGIGAAFSWDENVSGTTWTGSEARAATGVPSGAGLVDAGGGHVASGIMGFTLADGSSQEVVMSPSITTGTRKILTDVDLAFIRDAGFTTIPEPTIGSLFIIGAALLARRRRECRAQLGVNS